MGDHPGVRSSKNLAAHAHICLPTVSTLPTIVHNSLQQLMAILSPGLGSVKKFKNKMK